MNLKLLFIAVIILLTKIIFAMECEQEKNVTLVLMGKTGVGKSSTVNAFSNFATETAWNAYPKYFLVPTSYQACNIANYIDCNNEDHSRGQLRSVTQKVAKYTAKGPFLVVNLIDCPGFADTRGVQKDFQITENIAHFLAESREINAICIVLKYSTNRTTAEEVYTMDQIKTLIPMSMLNRVFVILTHGSKVLDKAKSFVQSVGLPIDKIFAFDHFALSKEGYADPKTSLEIAMEVEHTWQMSKKAFSQLIEQAKSLGKCSTDEYRMIHHIKISSSEKIILAKAREDDIKEIQKNLKDRQIEFENAINEYLAAFAVEQVRGENFAKAELEKQNAHGIVCSSGLCYETNDIWFHEYFFRCPVKARQKRALAECEIIKNDLDNAQQELEKKTQQKNRIAVFVDKTNSEIDALKKQLNSLLEEIVDLYVKLSKISLGSISLQLENYLNLCIKNTSDPVDRAKLERDREFYIQPIKLYRERLKNSW